MFVNNINPVLLKLGPLQIRYYGIIYALGFLLLYLFLRHYSKEKGIKIKEKGVEDLVIYFIIGIVIGARLFNFIFYEPYVIFRDPLEILRIWHGGMSFHGGLIGATLALVIFAKKYKVRFMHMADAIVIPTALALALGRIGNFLNQELYGFASNLPWCVIFRAIDNTCRHPYQLYASLSHLIMFIILIFIYKKQKREGATFWSFILLYGSFRVITDIFRYEQKFLGIISTGQMLSLIMAIIAAIILIKRRD
jgi:phosphatidylglycerol:prolipoprotein diacylglycerol transferase